MQQLLLVLLAADLSLVALPPPCFQILLPHAAAAVAQDLLLLLPTSVLRLLRAAVAAGSLAPVYLQVAGAVATHMHHSAQPHPPLCMNPALAASVQYCTANAAAAAAARRRRY